MYRKKVIEDALTQSMHFYVNCLKRQTVEPYNLHQKNEVKYVKRQKMYILYLKP